MRKAMTSNGKTWEAIVVGGGPAGTAFAFAAGSQGHHVCVLEKAPIPSPKVCGGVLSPRCLRLFTRLGLEEVVHTLPAQALNHLAVERAGGKVLHIPFPLKAGPPLVVDRPVLDAALWQAAGKAGAHLQDRTIVTRIAPQSSGSWNVEARCGKETSTLTSRVLIGADGRHSLVARQLGLPLKSKGRSLCFQYRLARHAFDRNGVHFLLFPGGYCGLSVDGTGLAHLDVISLAGGESEAALRERLESQPGSFVERLKHASFAPGRPVTRSPIGSGSRPLPNHPNVALLGDAQAWVEPFTGEGISLALESAHLVVKSFSKGQDLRHAPPQPSRTNRWVAQAIAHPRIAQGLITLLHRAPFLASWMAREVLIRS